MPQETVLVTGGAGFVGSHLCDRLLADGAERVICLDNLSSGRAGNVAHLANHPAFEFHEADVTTLAPEAFPQADRIYHLASRASPTDFEEHAFAIAEANTTGIRHALEAAERMDARLLYTSTSEVYGDPLVHPQSEEYRGNVSIRGPRACYDVGKRFGETLVSMYRRQTGLDARTVRIFNTYGPRMRPGDGRVIPSFVSQALAGDPLTIYGDGEQTRSFCYVDDLVEGLVRVMDAPDPPAPVYNLGSDAERSINDLARAVTELTGHDAGVTYDPLPQDDPTQRRPDLTRIRTDLGWEPTTPLADGLLETIDAFRS